MRVLRVVMGMLTLLVAMPLLAVGAGSWWAMQHRSADGAFHAKLAPIDTPGRVVVVPDVDALLRRDAPFTRAGQTTLRLVGRSGGEPVFVGVAAPIDVAAYLAGVKYTELLEARPGRGSLPVRTNLIGGVDRELAAPEHQDFWLRRGMGELAWSPSADRGRRLALVIVSPSDEPLRLDVAMTARWLNSTTWGLLILGPVLLLLGFAALAWPQRPREIVYVLDPAAAAAAGLPRPALPPPAPAGVAAAQALTARADGGVPADAGVPGPGTVPAAAVSGAEAAPMAPAAAPASVVVPAQPTRSATVQSSPEVKPMSTELAMPVAGRRPPAGRGSGARGPVPAELAWPPAEGPAVTEGAHEVPTQELPLLGSVQPRPAVGLRLERDRVNHP